MVLKVELHRNDIMRYVTAFSMIMRFLPCEGDLALNADLIVKFPEQSHPRPIKLTRPAPIQEPDLQLKKNAKLQEIRDILVTRNINILNIECHTLID